jgi:hypothetical protein
MKQAAANFTFADHPGWMFRHGTVTESPPACHSVKVDIEERREYLRPSTRGWYDVTSVNGFHATAAVRKVNNRCLQVTLSEGLLA